MVRLALTFMVALAATLFIASGARAQTFPKFTALVVDDAHILAPEQVAALDAKLTALQQQTGHQLVVATIGNLQGYPIEDYSYQLGRAWGVGAKQKNDGLLLVIAPKDRKVRVEVGPGLQGTVTDALSSVVINTQIAPKFKTGDYAGGINAGIDQLATLIQLPPEEAQKLAAQAAAQAQAHSRQAQRPQIGFGTIVFLVIGFFFFVLPMLRAMRGGGRRYGPGGVAVYPPGSGFGGGFLGGLAGNLAANAIARELGGGGRGGSWGGGSDWGGGDSGGGGFGGGFLGGLAGNLAANAIARQLGGGGGGSWGGGSGWGGGSDGGGFGGGGGGSFDGGGASGDW